MLSWVIVGKVLTNRPRGSRNQSSSQKTEVRLARANDCSRPNGGALAWRRLLSVQQANKAGTFQSKRVQLEYLGIPRYSQCSLVSRDEWRCCGDAPVLHRLRCMHPHIPLRAHYREVLSTEAKGVGAVRSRPARNAGVVKVSKRNWSKLDRSRCRFYLVHPNF